ncbi:unnamed protein product [Sphagnum jensenii]|uniref:Uncharacterized protein n=1 Tax=Sphagnum jensenii TaxID=128206 RepID=A0ABP1BZN8_9BRYO
MVVEVFFAPFRPEVIEDEAMENVERLSGVRKFAGVVHEEVGRIVIKFHGGFTKEHEGPGGSEVTMNFPFVPNALEGLPHVLSHGAINVTEEGSVFEGRGGLPMPLPWVPREVLNKAGFEDPEGWCFLTCNLQFLSDFESRPGAFLGENSDQAEVVGGDGDNLVGGGLDAPIGRHSFEFDRSSLSRGYVEDKIDPFEGGIV